MSGVTTVHKGLLTCSSRRANRFENLRAGTPFGEVRSTNEIIKLSVRKIKRVVQTMSLDRICQMTYVWFVALPYMT